MLYAKNLNEGEGREASKVPTDTSGIIQNVVCQLQISGTFITGRNLRICNVVTYLKANIGKGKKKKGKKVMQYFEFLTTKFI